MIIIFTIITYVTFRPRRKWNQALIGHQDPDRFQQVPGTNLGGEWILLGNKSQISHRCNILVTMLQNPVTGQMNLGAKEPRSNTIWNLSQCGGQIMCYNLLGTFSIG